MTLIDRYLSRRAAILLAGLLLSFPGFAEPQGPISSRELDDFVPVVAAKLRTARYMEGRRPTDCMAVKRDGWNDLPTKQCFYELVEKKPDALGKVIRKSASVVLLDPDDRTIAQWILNACRAVWPEERRNACGVRVLDHLWDQSGGQFPVQGVVYEDLLPEDGHFEAYGFVSGVTVLLPGLVHRGTSSLTDDQRAAALVAVPTATASVHAPARLVGTTRCEYRVVHPEVDVNGLKWLDVVARAEREAMHSNRNELIEIWLKFHRVGRRDCDDALCPGDSPPKDPFCKQTPASTAP